MRILAGVIIIAFSIALCGPSFAGQVNEEDRDSGSSSGSGNEALGGAVMGGLLGAGLGAAIGSASGHAGRGAAIGAGVGAVGGTLVGASQASKRSKEEAYDTEEMSEEPTYVTEGAPETSKIKKRVVREYDDEGNIISEKEVNN